MTGGRCGTTRARGTRLRTGESGVALVLCLLFMVALSVIAASLTILAQTESYASINYKMMSQARYGAEAGVHKALNFLINSYTLPGGAGDPLSNYNMTVSPVTYNGQPVVLSAVSGVASNYPLASQQTAFSAAAQGTLAAGGSSVGYAAYATLVSMRQISAYGSTTSSVVQTWRVTADGSITGGRTALVEVSALLEQQTVPAHTYSAFATASTCGALSLSGSAVIDSFDSTNFTIVNGKVVTQASAGNIGTNGNLTESGGATINGSLNTPRTGVGACSSGNVDALTQSGGATVTGGIVQLPQMVVYPAPAPPSPMPPTTNVGITKNSTCAQAGIPAANCSVAGSNMTLNPNGAALVLGNINVSGGASIHLTAGTYNINSIALSGNSTLTIDSAPVILNIAGQSQGTPLNLSGGTVVNSSMNSTGLEVMYGGAGSISLSGGTQSSMMVYAPNAAATMSGGTDFYGSVLVQTLNDSGGVSIHYDRHLASSFFTTGNSMLSSFTWKKYY